MHNPPPLNLSNSNNSLNSNGSNKAATGLLKDGGKRTERVNNSLTANALQLPNPSQQAQLENILDNLYSEKLKPTVEKLDLGEDTDMSDGDGAVKLSPRSDDCC